jgi:hypothetical protein
MAVVHVGGDPVLRQHLGQPVEALRQVGVADGEDRMVTGRGGPDDRRRDAERQTVGVGERGRQRGLGARRGGGRQHREHDGQGEQDRARVHVQ